MRLSLILVPFLVLGIAAHGRAQTSQPVPDRIRAAVARPQPSRPLRITLPAADRTLRERRPPQPASRDSVWNGALIGAGIGGVGGYFWAREICGGTDDTECFIITAPVGILAGAGIGALVGGVADALHK